MNPVHVELLAFVAQLIRSRWQEDSVGMAYLFEKTHSGTCDYNPGLAPGVAGSLCMDALCPDKARRYIVKTLQGCRAQTVETHIHSTVGLGEVKTAQQGESRKMRRLGGEASSEDPARIAARLADKKALQVRRETEYPDTKLDPKCIKRNIARNKARKDKMDALFDEAMRQLDAGAGGVRILRNTMVKMATEIVATEFDCLGKSTIVRYACHLCMCARAARKLVTSCSAAC